MRALLGSPSRRTCQYRGATDLNRSRNLVVALKGVGR